MADFGLSSPFLGNILIIAGLQGGRHPTVSAVALGHSLLRQWSPSRNRQLDPSFGWCVSRPKYLDFLVSIRSLVKERDNLGGQYPQPLGNVNHGQRYEGELRVVWAWVHRRISLSILSDYDSHATHSTGLADRFRLDSHLYLTHAMWHVLHLAAVPAVFLLGVFCVLTAIVLYPGEEGKIQSRLEDFWIRVDDSQKSALTRNAAFMRELARWETLVLDKVFGRELVSRRALAVSAQLSLPSVGVCWSAFRNAHPIPFAAILIIWFVTIYYCIPEPIGDSKPSPTGTKSVESLVLTATALVAVVAIYFHVFHPDLPLRFGIFPGLGLVAGFCCDALFIVATRRLLRWAGEMVEAYKVLSVVILNTLIAILLVSPMLLLRHLLPGRGPMVLPSHTFLAFALWSNLVDVALALLFVFAAAILLIHHALWPLLTRTLFRMQDIGTKGRRGILMTVGLALLGWSGLKLPDLVRELVKALGKG